ncbi:MAG: cell division protein SepF [Christensenellales bacterium]
MAKKFFNKILDVIGIEEASLQDEEMDYDEFDSIEEEYIQEPVYTKSNRRGKVVDLPTGNGMKMVVYKPANYDDTQDIIDYLKARKPVVVNLETLEIDVAQRVLDFISGAVYSLNGSIHKVSKGIFVLAPTNVDISGNVADDLNVNTFYSLSKAQR